MVTANHHLLRLLVAGISVTVLALVPGGSELRGSCPNVPIDCQPGCQSCKPGTCYPVAGGWSDLRCGGRWVDEECTEWPCPECDCELGYEPCCSRYAIYNLDVGFAGCQCDCPWAECCVTCDQLIVDDPAFVQRDKRDIAGLRAARKELSVLLPKRTKAR